LRKLLGWLNAAGYSNLLLVDNASTYRPLVNFLATVDAEVVRLKDNVGQLAPWRPEVRGKLDPNNPFVVTDCDVVPDENCPEDVVEHLAGLLLRYANVDKVGLGLRIDDLPDCYALKAQVLAWESQFSEIEVAPGVFQGDVDTTFALYRSPADGHGVGRALRTGEPYVARHLPWYADSSQPTDEQRYYLAHANPAMTHWEGGAATDDLRQLLARRAGELATSVAMLEPWTEEPPTRDETAYTLDARPGWPSWNATSPESEFCEFAGGLTRLIRPALVIETGVGHGFVTRRIAQQLGPGQQLISFEGRPALRRQLERLPFFASPDHVLGTTPSPSHDDFSRADLTVLDSEFPLRLDEMDLWIAAARPGAVLLVHDAGNPDGPLTPAHLMGRDIAECSVSGVVLRNPRGGFLAIKADETMLRQARATVEELEGRVLELQVRLNRILDSPPARVYDKLRGLPGVRRLVQRRTDGYVSALQDAREETKPPHV
jgi:hypothetical protein